MSSSSWATSVGVAVALAAALGVPWGWHSAQDVGLQTYELSLWRLKVSAGTDKKKVLDASLSEEEILELRCEPGTINMPCGTWNMFNARSHACGPDSDDQWCDLWTRMVSASVLMFVCGMNSVALFAMGAKEGLQPKFSPPVTLRRTQVFNLLGAAFWMGGLLFYTVVTYKFPHFGQTWLASCLLSLAAFIPWIGTMKTHPGQGSHNSSFLTGVELQDAGEVGEKQFGYNVVPPGQAKISVHIGVGPPGNALPMQQQMTNPTAPHHNGNGEGAAFYPDGNGAIALQSNGNGHSTGYPEQAGLDSTSLCDYGKPLGAGPYDAPPSPCLPGGAGPWDAGRQRLDSGNPRQQLEGSAAPFQHFPSWQQMGGQQANGPMSKVDSGGVPQRFESAPVQAGAWNPGGTNQSDAGATPWDANLDAYNRQRANTGHGKRDRMHTGHGWDANRQRLDSGHGNRNRLDTGQALPQWGVTPMKNSHMLTQTTALNHSPNYSPHISPRG